jgi:exosome complex component RRP42
MEEVIAEIQRDYMYNLVKQGKRIDGRKFDEYRKIQVEMDVISKAEGSSRVKIGDTDVLVGVKMQPDEPYSDTPDMGTIITNVELAPIASPSFEPGPPNEEAIEIARIVDRGVRESEAINLSELCIEEGKKVWILFIDVHVLDYDGNLVDASALGAIAALLCTHIPKQKYDLGEDQKLEIRKMPIATTVVSFEGRIMIDPNLSEEKIAPVKFTTISNEDGSISGMQKSGSAWLTHEEISKIVDLGIEKSKELRSAIKMK